MTPNPNVQKEWADEFDEKFSPHNVKSWAYEECDCTDTDFEVCRNNIKDFITNLLASHNNSLVERLEGLKRDKWEEPAAPGQGYPLQVFNFALTEAQELIKNSLT